MGRPTATIGCHHVCPMIDPGPKPHIGGPVVSTQGFVRIDGKPVAVIGARPFCVGVGPHDPIVSGSSIARINGKAIARVGDRTAHSGTLVGGAGGVRID